MYCEFNNEVYLNGYKFVHFDTHMSYLLNKVMKLVVVWCLKSCNQINNIKPCKESFGWNKCYYLTKYDNCNADEEGTCW